MPASYMVISIKNNLSLLSRREKLRNTLSTNSNGEITVTEYNLPKASKKELKSIGKRVREEHKLRMVKVIVLTIILFLGLVYAFIYSSDGIIELLTY